ncbi:MAG: hypothetical protein R3F34_10715 [Planctomycetota bacterium]
MASGTWRITLHAARGVDFDGGHTTTQGLDPMGAVVVVPLHRHEVSLDFVRFEAVGSYAVADDCELTLRLPYDVKDRRAAVRLVDPATPDEIAAMEANLAIHHPSERLEGVSDATLLVTWYRTDAAVDGDGLHVSVGTTLPIGRTEEDPYELGDEGEPHEHVQFGTGTFDPVVEASYRRGLAPGVAVAVSFAARASLYENRHGYRGPFEATLTPRLDVDLSERLTLHAGAAIYFQGRAAWSGVRDENTGVLALSGLVGVGWRVGPSTTVSADLLLPVAQHVFDDESDGFEPGPVLFVGVSAGVGPQGARSDGATPSFP